MAADTGFSAVEPLSSGGGDLETASGRTTAGSERSRLDEHVHDWFVSRGTDAGYDEVTTDVRYRRRRRHVSTLHHLSTTGDRRRVFRRCTTVRRRCALVVRRRRAADVTSGDDVTTASAATDGDWSSSSSSCLDRAFVHADSARRGVAKWQPDLSAVVATSTQRRRRGTAERRRTEDDDITQSTDSASPTTILTACDTVGFVSSSSQLL